MSMKKINIRGTIDRKTYGMFRGILISEGKSVNQGLEDAIRLYLKNKGIEIKS